MMFEFAVSVVFDDFMGYTFGANRNFLATLYRVQHLKGEGVPLALSVEGTVEGGPFTHPFLCGMLINISNMSFCLMNEIIYERLSNSPGHWPRAC